MGSELISLIDKIFLVWLVVLNVDAFNELLKLMVVKVYTVLSINMHFLVHCLCVLVITISLTKDLSSPEACSSTN